MTDNWIFAVSIQVRFDGATVFAYDDSERNVCQAHGRREGGRVENGVRWDGKYPVRISIR